MIALAEVALGHDLDPRLGDRDDELTGHFAGPFKVLSLEVAYDVLASHSLL